MSSPLGTTTYDAPDAATVSSGRHADGIVTPEAVVLDVETAGYASRILAGLLDIIAQLVLVVMLSLIVGLVLRGDDSSVRTAIAIVWFLVLFGYPIGFETLTRGRTLGKMALGIRAVTTDGAPIRLREASLRAMGGVVDKLLPPGGVTGALFVVLTPRHQRIGDLIAGTMVIRDPEKYVITPALWFSALPGLEAYAETIDPTAITVEQYTVVRSFLTRGASLSPHIRHTLAIDLANRLAERIRHVPPKWLGPEDFLICVMARYQRRNGPGKATGVIPQGASLPGMAPPPSAYGDQWNSSWAAPPYRA